MGDAVIPRTLANLKAMHNHLDEAARLGSLIRSTFELGFYNDDGLADLIVSDAVKAAHHANQALELAKQMHLPGAHA